MDHGLKRDSRTFVQVVAGEVKGVTAGCYHTMLLKHDGSVWSTGDNFFGQLGDGTVATRHIFVQVITHAAKKLTLNPKP